MMGLAGELKKREHDATIATSAYHRSAAEKAGFGFHEIAPNLDPADRELIDAVLDMRNLPPAYPRRRSGCDCLCCSKGVQGSDRDRKG